MVPQDGGGVWEDQLGWMVEREVRVDGLSCCKVHISGFDLVEQFILYRCFVYFLGFGRSVETWSRRKSILRTVIYSPLLVW